MFTIPTGCFNSFFQIVVVSYKDAVLADNPLLYYRLNETSGTSLTSLVNISQNTASYNGDITLNQISAVNDTSDKSAFINGINSYQSSIFSYIKLLTIPTISGDFSIEVWFKTNSLHPSGGAIIFKEGDCYLGIFNGYLFTFDFNTNNTTYLNEKLYNDNQWHHTVIVKQNGINNGTLIYIDGVEVTRTTITKTATNFIYLGIQPSDLSPGFIQAYEGNLDEIAVYNSLLIPAQITNHYLQSGRTVNPIAPGFNPTNKMNVPSQLPGLYLWANSSSVYNNPPGGVDRIQDLSGRYKHLTQTTVSKRPVFTPNVLGTKPVIRFNNTNTDGFNFPTCSAIRTVYWVLRREPTNNAEFFLLGASNDGTINSYGFHGGGGNTWFEPTYTHPNILNAPIFRINGVNTSPTGNFKMASNEYITIALVTNGNVVADSFSFDRANANVARNASLYGDLVELIIYEQAHTLDQVQQMEAYLQQYGHY